MQNKTPYKLLLQSKGEPNSTGGRSEQQIQLLSQLCINNNIFEYLGLAKNSLRQLCDKMTLIWADNPHTNQLNDNQLYLVLEGKAFEYLQNKSFVLKNRLKDNEQYLMVRKLLPNDFFVVYCPQAKYSQQYDFKKYQLMIDKNTLVAKISGETFKRLILPLIEQRWRKIVIFLKKVDMLQHIPQAMLYQLSKYMQYVTYQSGTQIINRNQKNLNVYFIINGQVEYRIYNDINSRESPSKNYHTVHTKPFKKTNLKDNQVFGIDAFNSHTYEQIEMSYSTEAKTLCNMYKIDKRILAIVISSFDNILNKNNKIWSSVNLNEQIQGQGYKTADMDLLSRNAQKIKTSEKRIRDIKLRFYNTSHRNRLSFVNDTDNDKKQDLYETIEDVKYQSCQNFAQVKVNNDKNKRFYETMNPKIKINNFAATGEIDNRDPRTKLSSIVLAPYDTQTQVQTAQRQNLISTSQMQRTTKKFFSKRKSDPNLIPTGKQQSDIIRSYLQKKLKNEMLKKAELILQRNKQKKVKESIKVKRIYSWKNLRSKSNFNQQTSQKQLGDQLYERMNKLSQNPLLSQIQGQRKKLQIQSIKLKQSQVKNIKRNSTPVKIQKNQPIIIQNS